MSRRSRWLAFLAGIGLALAAGGSAFGYTTQVPHTITVIPSLGTFTCGTYDLVRATVLALDGKPIKSLTVSWSFASSPAANDKIKKTSTKTNKQGVATTRVRLACVLGDRVIRATTGGISGTAVIHVRLGGHGDEGQVLGTTGTPGGAPGLPNTATLPAETSTDGLNTTPAVPVVVGILVALAFLARRFPLRRPDQMGRTRFGRPAG